MSSNVNLERFFCENNPNLYLILLTEANTTLYYLRCQNNDLPSLSLSNFEKLSAIFCGGNQLTNINVTDCPAISRFYCFNNLNLTSLNLLSGIDILS